MSGIAGFSALYPWLLTAVPIGFGLLVYVYRRRGTGKRLVVASLLLLRTLERTPQARQRFFPPLRFFLELLIVLLLGLAAAQLYPVSEIGPLGLVIDTSLSMGAINPDEGSQRTFLDTAITRAQAAIAEESERRPVKLFEAGKSSPVFSGTVGDLGPALEALRPRYQNDALEAGVALSAADSTLEEILVISDRPERTVTAKTKAKIRYLGLRGTTATSKNMGNIAITELSQVRSERSATIRATVRNFGRDAVTVALTLSGISDAGSSSRIQEQRLEIPAQSSASPEFTVELNQIRAYRVSVRAQGESARRDLLRNDNDGWISLTASDRTIGVVSDLTPQELGLSRLPRFRFIAIPRTAWAEAKVDSLALVIFHRWAPQALPTIPSLSILPPPDSRPFALASTAPTTSPELTRWADTSPLLTYVNVAALSFAKSLPLQSQPWAQSIISTSGGSVMQAGEQGSQRHVAMGFEIFPFEGSNSVGLGILLLNSLRWLSELTFHYDVVGVTVTPEAVMLDPAQPIDSVVVSRPGLVSEGGSLKAVNFFSDPESDLNSITPFEPPTGPGIANVPLDVTKTAAQWARGLAGAVLVLLLVDLILFGIRRRRS